jgi:hypothetical protein
VGTPVLEGTTWGSLALCDTFQIVGSNIIDELVHKKAVHSLFGQLHRQGGDKEQQEQRRGGLKREGWPASGVKLPLVQVEERFA